MLKYFASAALIALGACAEVPQPGPRDAVVVGQTQGGAPVYRYQLTRTNALGITPIPNSAIAARSAQICPGGYRELDRSGFVERRISGVVYTDVTVTLVCTP